MDWIAAYQKDLARKKFVQSSIERYPFGVRKFEKFLKEEGSGATLVGVKRADLMAYLDYLQSKNLKSSTIKWYFACLHSFYEFLIFLELLEVNPVNAARKQYLTSGKGQHDSSQRRQCITNDQARDLVASIDLARDKAAVVLLLKTGLRNHELVELDVDDVDLKEKIIHLKPAKKRTSEIVLFDSETARVLKKWLMLREKLKGSESSALFLSHTGDRLSSASLTRMVKKYAQAAGLHDPSSKRLDKRFSPHCCRHWFSTQLNENRCPLTVLRELRGDNREGIGAIGGYLHIDRKTLREWYERCIPKLGV